MRTVLFTQRVETVEAYGERRDTADQRVAGFLRLCGFLPVPLPNEPETAKEIFGQFHPVGIVLTGGNSLEKYGGNAPERDSTDTILLTLAIRENVPLYGFCRGMQSILDYFGNDLAEVEGHVAVRHLVSGKDAPQEVNSYHNQGCLELVSSELEVLLRAKDGVIEKVGHKRFPILGTMWHPERETPFREQDLFMVRKLFGG